MGAGDPHHLSGLSQPDVIAASYADSTTVETFMQRSNITGGPFSSIAEATLACRSSLTDCLEIESLKLEWAEDRLADFKLWDTSIGASLKTKKSLDERLGSKSHLRNVILGLLSVLKSTIDQCRQIANHFTEASPTELESESLSEILLEAVQAADTLFNDLARLGAKIRKALVNTHVRKADSLFNPDSPDLRRLREHFMRVVLFRPKLLEDNRNIFWEGPGADLLALSDADQYVLLSTEGQWELSVSNQYKLAISEHHARLKRLERINLQADPGSLSFDSNDLTVVQKRLIEANLRRNHRFIYSQNHELKPGREESQTQDVLTRPAPSNQKAPSSLYTPKTPLAINTNMTHDKEPARENPSIKLPQSDTTASAIDTHRLNQVQTSAATSQQSRTDVSGILSKIKAQYPRPPTGHLETRFQCPCCCTPLDFRGQTRWRKHINADLQPYTCVLRGCTTPDILYTEKDNWLRHMRDDHVHATHYWQCSLCDDAMQFNKSEGLTVHIKEVHEDAIPEDQLPAFIQTCSRPRLLEDSTCPLCSMVDTGEDISGELMLEHVAEHVHSFALNALPLCYDDEDKEHPEKYPYFQTHEYFADSNENASNASQGSTIGSNDPDNPPTFGSGKEVGPTSVTSKSNRSFSDSEKDANHLELPSFQNLKDEGERKRKEHRDKLTEPQADIELWWSKTNAGHGPEVIPNDRTEISSKGKDGERDTDTIGQSTETITRKGSPIKDLTRAQIKKEMAFPTYPSQRFIPINAMVELVNEKAVLSALRRKQKNLRTDLEMLTQFICGLAPKLFMILVWIGEEEMVDHAYKNGFTDAMLPVIEQSNEDPKGTELRSWEARLSITDQTFNDEIWHEISLDQFRNQQWLVLSPVFRRDQFRYQFHEQCRMPFLESKRENNQRVSHLSMVEERRIHRDHIEFSSLTNEHPTIALKQFVGGGLSDLEFREIVLNEVETLERLRDLNHPHLIRAIAYYTLGARHRVVFPWAGLGNLRDFWKIDPPQLDEQYLKWVLTQLCGLADGIARLHYSGEDYTMRHGDLKPENILCFQSTEMVEAQEGPCILVIADVGLTKAHALATEMRQEATRTRSGTVMYEPPEADFESQRNIPMSRRYDIWSMGCVYLEFVIWLLYGAKELERFIDDLGEDKRFYSRRDMVNSPIKTPQLHMMVRKWVDWITDDAPCSENTALRHLVELIVSRLLVLDLGKAKNLNRADSILYYPQASHSPKETPSVDPIGPSIIRASTSSTYLEFADSSFTQRATAEEMKEGLQQILRDAESSRIEWMNIDAPRMKGPGQFRHDLAPTNVGLVVPPRNTDYEDVNGPARERSITKDTGLDSVEEYTYTPLNDNFEYIPDYDFASHLMRNMGTSYLPEEIRTPPQLCERCGALELWRPRCSFIDIVAALRKKSWVCGLCQLISRQIEGWGVEKQKTLQFFRNGSNLVCSERPEQPITSLYADTGSELISYGIQPGMPCLPVLGSDTHTKLLAAWISDCDRMHQCIKPSGVFLFLPTRILDVQDIGSLTVHLVCHNRGHNEIGKYLALSYRWGSPLESLDMCTTRSNIEQFERSIEVAELPRTFQHAVEVTRSLGLKYLWIDALCIVQDDEEDWKYEAQRMDQIYSAAYATIGATRARSSHDGLFKPRLERKGVTMTKEDKALYYVCDTIDNFHKDVDQAELNQRGWVLQERALSRRTIYFTDKQCYWECGEGVRCETLTKMNNKASFLGDANFPYSVVSHVKGLKIKVLQDLFERYSNLKLTYSRDRPIAIHGLEKRLLHTFNTVGGYGIFGIYFYRCLIWQRSVPALKRIPSSCGAPIPTWSWMAYEGGIKYMDIPFGKVSWNEAIISPFSSGKSGTEDQTTLPMTIDAPIWDLVGGLDHQFILDDPFRDSSRPIKCVVVGTSEGTDVERQLQYALIITKRSRAGMWTGATWKRAGVAILERQHILFEEGSVMASIG